MKDPKNFTPDMIEAAKTAKDPRELRAMAEKNHVVLTEEEATVCFKQLNPPMGELDDDDLDAVAGGGCGSSSPTGCEDPIPPFGTHLYMKNGCPGCGACSTSGFVKRADEYGWAVVCNDCSTTVTGSGRGDFWSRFSIHPDSL